MMVSGGRQLSLGPRASRRRITQNNKNNRFVCRFLFLAEFNRLDYAMPESDRSATPSVESISAELETVTPSCPDPTRRALILAAVATGACMASSGSAAAGEDQPGSDERPQKADVLVFSEGEHAGEVIMTEGLTLGGPPVRAWPKDPKTSVVRKGSRLNELVVVRLDPAELDDETRTR